MPKKMNVQGLTNELMESAFFVKTKPAQVLQTEEKLIDTESIEKQLNITQEATSRNDVKMSPNDEIEETQELEVEEVFEVDDITTSHTDVAETSQITDEKKVLNEKRLTQIVQSILEIETVPFTTPVRMSVQEKRELEEYVTVKLKKRGVPKTKISISKVIRICTLYMMKNNEEEFTEILVKAIKNRGRLKF